MATLIMPGSSNFGKVNPGVFQHFRNADGSIDTGALFSLALLVSETNSGDSLGTMLSQQTGELITASSIPEARSLLQVNLVELVVLTMDCEEGDLHDFVQEVRRLRPDLPILLIASDDVRKILQLIQLGAWDFADLSANALNEALQRLAERKLAEMQKVQSQIERSAFWAAVHNAPDGLGILGSTGTVLFANMKFLDFCAALAGQAVSNPDLPVLLHTHDPSAAAQLEEQLKEHSAQVAWQTEVKIQDRHFGLFLSSVTFGEIEELSPLSDSVRIAAPRLFVLWMRDITERKEQEQFRRDLLSATTHDLKGPLGAILGGVSLLKNSQENRPGDDEKLIVSIGASARSCVSLIEDLLSAHKMEAGSLLVRPARHDLEEILENVARDYLNTAQLHKINLSVLPVPEDFQIYADYLGLHRVLSNLLSNAIKFTKEGGKVEVSALRTAGEVRITVRDTGDGIDPAEQSGIFDKYTRLRKHDEVTGSGLGLYIAKAIITAHGGRIELESKLGIGSTFTVCLPDN